MLNDLIQANMEKKVAIYQWFLQKIDNYKEFLNDVWFSNEAHFLLNGQVNSKNQVFCGSENLQRVVEDVLH